MGRDRADEIRQNLPISAANGLPHIRLHRAVPESGVWRLARDGVPPYWAWCWPGGLALAHHFIACPEAAAGRTVLDLGAGSGLVAIAAALAGARRVIACDIDPLAITACTLNAAINAVSIETECVDLLDGSPPQVDVIAVGDLFYEPVVAARLLPFLGRCRDAGIDVLVGDIGRSDLPRDALIELAHYPVSEFGEGGAGGMRMAGVFRLAFPGA